MLRNFMMWASLCATALGVCAQEPTGRSTTTTDSIEYSIPTQLLDEIVINASPVISKTDRRIVRPRQEILRSSADGLDLLRKLQLPGISVNPISNKITVRGTEEVTLCINGIETSAARITAIRPDEIIRVEYHDNPGARYAGAAAVIDFITSRHDSGVNLSLDAFGAFANGRWASIDHFAGQYNHGRSVWDINIGYMGQRKDKWIRDYDETWNYPDAPLVRHESGLPVTVGGHGLESQINYNYLHPQGHMLNVRIGADMEAVPNQEEGDRRALLLTSGTGTAVMVTEHTEERSVRPSLGLYYSHQLSSSANLTFEGEGSYRNSEMLHSYSEGGLGEESRVDGEKYAMKFSTFFQHRSGKRSWSVGLTGRSSFTENRYRQAEDFNIGVSSSDNTVYGEYTDRFGPWGIMANAGISYRHLAQSGKSLDRVFFSPTATVSFRPDDRFFLRYTASLDHRMPDAAEISDVTQPVQTGMVRRGNPDLKPFRIVSQTFSASFESRVFGIEGRVDYQNEHKPVMESVIFRDDTFVRTFFNQRSFQKLAVGASLSLRPWEKHLSLSAQPLLTRYFSHGNDYRHCHSIFRIALGVDFTYGNWLLYGNIMSGPANRMYGEEIIEEKDMNTIMVGYKKSQWSIHLGVFNAFLKNYSMETRNLSALAPYTSKAHSDRSSSYIALKFNLSLDFGVKGRMVEIPQAEKDSGSGILSGNK